MGLVFYKAGGNIFYNRNTTYSISDKPCGVKGKAFFSRGKKKKSEADSAQAGPGEKLGADHCPFVNFVVYFEEVENLRWAGAQYEKGKGVCDESVAGCAARWSHVGKE